MNPKQTVPPAPIITLEQIYYILFRHKWLIAIVAVLAVAVAVGVRFFWPWPYHSEARLLIKYIKETRPPQESPSDAPVTTPDARGESILNNEILILTSMDLAEKVADSIGPAKILANAGGGSNVLQAAAVIKMGLSVQTSTNRSDVLDVVFTHADPDMTAQILTGIIEAYQTKHKEIYRPEYNNSLTETIDTLQHDEEETDAQLREAKSNANIISLDDSKKTYNDQVAELQLKLNDAEAELAGYRESIKQLRKLIPGAAAALPTNASVNNGPDLVPPDKTAVYQQLCTQFESQEAEALKDRIYTTNNVIRQIAEAQVAATEAQKTAMEQKYPGLLAVAHTMAQTPGQSRPEFDPRQALNDEIIKEASVAAKVQYLTNRLAQVQNYGATIIAKEGYLERLEGKRTNEDRELSFYWQKLEEGKIEQVFDPGNSNISEVETPTPPMRDLQKIQKMTLTVLGLGLLLAFGLPFLIELVLDRSLKHPMDVQAKLGLPFFISIPQQNGTGKIRALLNGKKPALLAAKSNGGGEPVPGEPGPAAPVAPANGELAHGDHLHSLQPFYETLRDRLMTYFEMINLTHKPKLVAVTSCREGAGVTTTAAGLASSLSETGDGNVLLVNMNIRDGQTHHFYKGKLACGLDEALEKETRGGALVEGNLYVAREHPDDDRLPRVLPKRFSHLLPKMKASDFDYIIFDMPPISQISITPRLARFMDMVLLVIESGKTDRDAAKRAADLLSESKANVGIVLNKNRSYIPRSLHHDI